MFLVEQNDVYSLLINLILLSYKLNSLRNKKNIIIKNKEFMTLCYSHKVFLLSLLIKVSGLTLFRQLLKAQNMPEK